MPEGTEKALRVFSELLVMAVGVGILLLASLTII
jgi:hypothetical protein